VYGDTGRIVAAQRRARSPEGELADAANALFDGALDRKLDLLDVPFGQTSVRDFVVVKKEQFGVRFR
jgi:hypothetical protein